MTNPRTPDDGDTHGVRRVLDALAAGAADERIALTDVLRDLQQRGFGLLLLIAALPSFLPIPGVAGGVSGPLAMLIGAQMLIGLRKPWLPQWLAKRGPPRRMIARFHQAADGLLRRLEKFVRPRLPWMFDALPARVFTGLLLLLLGLLLALPIPFTNYLFGALLLLYVFALLERDGVLLLIAWLLGAAAIVVFGIASGSLWELAVHAWQRL